jgi:hypothetical protein
MACGLCCAIALLYSGLEAKQRWAQSVHGLVNGAYNANRRPAIPKWTSLSSSRDGTKLSLGLPLE